LRSRLSEDAQANASAGNVSTRIRYRFDTHPLRAVGDAAGLMIGDYGWVSSSFGEAAPDSDFVGSESGRADTPQSPQHMEVKRNDGCYQNGAAGSMLAKPCARS
jgi:hypothetical protein